jgi:pimeloyl-ACP methyl ester carboxylesterase
MEKTVKSGYAPVNGLNMYYEIHGSAGIPLVLIHGGGSTIESSFGKLLPFFTAYTSVIAVELQAHGRTEDRDAPESFEQDADDVAALLRYLKVGKANIFGFSNGGSTAMQVAIRHPSLVNKMIVAAGAYRRDGFIPGFFDGFSAVTLADMPDALKDAYLKVAPDKTKLLVMFEKDVARMKAFTDWRDDDLRSIQADTLVMAADHDVVMPEHAMQLSRLIPGAKLAILPGYHGAFMGAAEAGASDGGLVEVTALLVEGFLR